MYRINFKKSAQKELLAIPSVYQVKIIDAIDALANDPRPDGVLHGHRGEPPRPGHHVRRARRARTGPVGGRSVPRGHPPAQRRPRAARRPADA